MSFRIANQDSTIACLLRDSLFNFEVEFASCTLLHPQDTCLHVTIQCSDNTEPKTLLDEAIQNINHDLENMLQILQSKLVHDTIMFESAET